MRQVDILDNLKVGLDLYATVRVFRTLGEGFGVPGLTATLWASTPDEKGQWAWTSSKGILLSWRWKGQSMRGKPSR